VASLFVIQGRDQGKRFELGHDVLRLGRDSSNGVQLFDTEVSRQHAELRRVGDTFTLVDLSSSNGTYVNSEQTERCELASGDRVQVGRTLMIFTGTEPRSSEELTGAVDIVARGPAGDGSRIVKSIRQEEGSDIFSDEGAQSPWLARARSNLQVMYRTSLAVSHTLDIDQLVVRIMELIFEWVEADRGCIMLVDPNSDELVPKVRRNRKGVSLEDAISISRAILDYVMERKEGVLTSDAREDRRWDPEGSILKLGVREAICVPMQGRYGIVGVIYIDTYTPPGRMLDQQRSNRFNEEHLKLMVAIAHQAALAVEDTNYYSAMVHAERLAAVGQTIATLSHHIKNILQGIRGGSYLIEEGLKGKDPDVLRKGWTIVDKNQEKISNLVLDMLSFSKEREPEPSPSNLNDVTAEVVELMQARADEAKVVLRWQPDEKMPQVMLDADAMHRAILNVVTNAIDACDETEDGCVVVTTEYAPAESAVRVIVRDNGLGIEPDDIKRIFTVFESHKGSRGTGLGLPVSQKVLREHGGDVLVTSTPGEGSRFTLELPAEMPEPSSRRQRPDDTQGWAKDRRPKTED